jgi:hypothetical protein
MGFQSSCQPRHWQNSFRNQLTRQVTTSIEKKTSNYTALQPPSENVKSGRVTVSFSISVIHERHCPGEASGRSEPFKPMLVHLTSPYKLQQNLRDKRRRSKRLSGQISFECSTTKQIPTKGGHKCLIPGMISYYGRQVSVHKAEVINGLLGRAAGCSFRPCPFGALFQNRNVS